MRQQSKEAKCRWLSLAGVVYALLISGCGTIAPVVSYPGGVAPPRTIAVLPFVNETNSVTAARLVRKTMHENVVDKGYIALDGDEVDQILSNRFGISIGEQISENLIPEIGKALKVDAVVTGVVKKYARADFLQNKIESEATFAIHEVETGNRLWHHQVYGASPLLVGQPMAKEASPFPNQGVQGGAQGHPFYRNLFCAIPTGAAPQKSVFSPNKHCQVR